MKFNLIFENNKNSELFNNYLEIQQSLNNEISKSLSTNSKINVDARIVLPSYEYILRSFPTIGNHEEFKKELENNEKIIFSCNEIREYLSKAIMSQSENGMSVNRINFPKEKGIQVYETESEYENAINEEILKSSVHDVARKNSLFVAMIKISSFNSDISVVYDPIKEHDITDNYGMKKKLSTNHMHSLCINIKGFTPIKCIVNCDKLNNQGQSCVQATTELSNKIFNVLHTALTDVNKQPFKLKFDHESGGQILDLIYAALYKGYKYKDDGKDVSIFFPNKDGCNYIIEPVNRDNRKTDFIVRYREFNESYTNTEGLDDITYHKLYRFC